jgi:hypothetical protein
LRNTRTTWNEANDYAIEQGGRLPYHHEIIRIIAQNLHGTVKDGNGGYIDISSVGSIEAIVPIIGDDMRRDYFSLKDSATYGQTEVQKDSTFPTYGDTRTGNLDMNLIMVIFGTC